MKPGPTSQELDQPTVVVITDIFGKEEEDDNATFNKESTVVDYYRALDGSGMMMTQISPT